ncbi:PREDICTED: Bardet-Biedl syndrome 1 protein [Ceratosolen solmsi marchali]|uniref:Bardet-Biedl syndrome 1 protein n=1 Tax=Ceratosolen solmsi marchali TaxID=326594 RepID=A0AAJ7DT82_9HYME|nr:PREDICTED: Bardet-Biedl syndrome 1 protein [Ceratosolen solmsi marchali]
MTMSGRGLNSSRWLDAIWEPNARIHNVPNGMDMLDLTGDGDTKLIILDLGSSTLKDIKLRILNGANQIAEYTMVDIPSSIIGFHTENNNNKSAVLAVGSCSSILIFKNLKPHFKFCLPLIPAHPKELNIWYKTNMDAELNIFTLKDDLKILLKEIGAASISSRTLKFLSLKTEIRQNFVEQYRKLSLFKVNVITSMSTIRKDAWTEIAFSYLVVGTEGGEILILDHRGFLIVEKYIIGWPPVAVTSSGLWAGDGQIALTGRDGQIGVIERGKTLKTWEKLSAPAVAMTILSSQGVAVVTMNSSFFAFSKQGRKLWKVQLPGNPLDMVSLPLPQNGLFLLAISIAGFGVRIYDQRHHIDTIKALESVASLKYGRLGQEEHTMAMITFGGGLNIKILKRTADFRICPYFNNNFNSLNNIKFTIPKKTTLSIEQTIREKSETTHIHRTFQQGFLRLRLNISSKVQNILIVEQQFQLLPLALQCSILGFGPQYKIKIYVTCLLERYLPNKFFLVCRNANILVKPRVITLPFIAVGFHLPAIITLVIKNRIPNRIQILVCYKGQLKPLNIITITLPITEDQIE